MELAEDHAQADSAKYRFRLILTLYVNKFLFHLKKLWDGKMIMNNKVNRIWQASLSMRSRESLRDESKSQTPNTSLLYLQPNFRRRTSGYCLRNYRAHKISLL